MIQVGLIGAGYWGGNYIKTIRGMREAQLRWVCNRYNRIEKKDLPFGSKFTRNYRDILGDKSTDAVIVSTPPETHYQITKDALNAGKDVLVEKPMTYSSEEAIELSELAREKHRVLMVGHIFLYNQAIIDLKEMVDRGDLGNLLYLESRRMGIANRTEANAMWCLAPHDVSIANYLLGGKLPISVSASGKSWREEGVEDFVHLELDYENDVRADISSCWAYPKKVRRLVLFGTKNVAVFDDMAQNKIEIFEPSGKMPIESKGFDGISPLERQCAHFFECVKTREEPLTGGREGYENVRILEAGQKSLKSGETILLT